MPEATEITVTTSQNHGLSVGTGMTVTTAGTTDYDLTDTEL